MAALLSRIILIIRLVTIGAWLAFLVWLQNPPGTEQLAKLLHPDLWWLIRTATLVLFLFGVASIGRRATQHADPFKLPGIITGCLLLLLPLLYFFNIGQSQLGENALRKRSLTNLLELIPEEAGGPATHIPLGGWAKPSSPDDDAFQTLISRPTEHYDRKLHIVGMVHHDKALGPNAFFCFRFRISCCAADAMPVGVVVRHRLAAKVPVGSWVRVQGIVRPGDNIAAQTPSRLVMEADLVSPTKAPDFPYIF